MHLDLPAHEYLLGRDQTGVSTTGNSAKAPKTLCCMLCCHFSSHRSLIDATEILLSCPPPKHTHTTPRRKPQKGASDKEGEEKEKEGEYMMEEADEGTCSLLYAYINIFMPAASHQL